MSRSPCLGLVDYGSGNLRSVQRAIEYHGAECRPVRSASDTNACSALLLPGVGSFGNAVRQLQELGLWDVILSWIASDRPYFGICLGYQLLFEKSEEGLGVEGLGILKGQVVRFSKEQGIKVPHIGWNKIQIRKREDSLMRGIDEVSDFYFVHSYYPIPNDSSLITSTCDYGIEFAASVTQGYISAVQFHPEKSQTIGLQLIRNFILSLKS